MANVPAVIQRVPVLAGKAVPAATGSARLVGVSRIDRATALKAANAVTGLTQPQKTKLAALASNRKLVLGGAAVGGAALIGFSADQLADRIETASSDELVNFIDMLDSVNKDAGSAVVDAHNQAVNYSELDTNFGTIRSDDGFLSQAPVTGLGLDRAVIEAQQTIQRQYDRVRGVMQFETLLSLQFLLAHASAADLTTLEDMRRYGQR